MTLERACVEWRSVAGPWRVLVLVLVLTATGSIAAARHAAAKPTSVRVMTWNWQNPQLSRAYQRDWTNVVNNQRPDILGLQEICVKWVQQLLIDLARKNLHYEVAYGTWQPDFRCGRGVEVSGAYGDALLIRKGVASIERKNTFRLPDVPTATDHEKRGVVWAIIKVGARTLPVWNTHIGVEGAQTQQIAVLARSVGTPKAGIVLGDLNSSPGDSALRPMWAHWKEADRKCKPTGGCKPSHDVQKKKDYIFVRGLRASSVTTVPTAVSDHHAVIATIPI